MLARTVSRHPWKVLLMLAALAALAGWLCFERLDAAALCAAITALVASRAPDLQLRPRRSRWDDATGMPLSYRPEMKTVRLQPLRRHPRPNG